MLPPRIHAFQTSTLPKTCRKLDFRITHQTSSPRPSSNNRDDHSRHLNHPPTLLPPLGSRAASSPFFINHGQSRSRLNQIPLQQDEAKRPHAPPLVLPNLRKSLQRRERLQDALPVRIAHPARAVCRAKHQASHRRLLPCVPTRVYLPSQDEPWRKGDSRE